MYRVLTTLVIGSALVGVPMLGGCDKSEDKPKVEKHTEEIKKDGTEVKKDTKINSDGSQETKSTEVKK